MVKMLTEGGVSLKMREYVIQIDFQDRLGLGYDIFQVCEKNHIDKIAMEAFPLHGMIIKFRCSGQASVDGLVQDLKNVPGVEKIKFRDQMPVEERAHELQTILNSVSEGIVAVDQGGKITHINEVACQIFHCTPQEAVGLPAAALFGVQAPIMETLKTGAKYKHMERKVQRGAATIHFMTSGVPVLNEKGQIIGAVCTISDFRSVQEIVYKVSENRRLATFDDIVYQSKVMANVVDCARTVAKGCSTVILRGESGTGKELFAMAIHMDSPRRAAPFIAVNCAALSDSLLESELFGYEEGAFTGAVKGGRKGLFEQAHGGTLFLDEIGEISPAVQVRLLRVLQEGMIRRVGGGREIPVDVRIVAATHRNLEDMISQRKFREDLYYRLNVIPITIPPLRERVEDIPLLVNSLLAKVARKLNRPQVRMHEECIPWLISQSWTGNVRQMENMLERLVNFTAGDEIYLAHLLEKEYGPNKKYDVSGNTIVSVSLEESGKFLPLKQLVAEVEKQALQKVLKRYKSSRKAGNVLGVSNTTILNKIKAYGLQASEEEL